MMLALVISKSRIRSEVQCATDSERMHVHIAFAELWGKLSYPAKVDKADVFVAHMLAIWSADMNRVATESHIRGVVAILGQLSMNLGHRFSASLMVPFLALMRDEVLWLTRNSEGCYQLCNEFREILGPKSIQQRQTYENELRGVMVPELGAPAAKVFFSRSMYTSIHTMIKSSKIISQCHGLKNLA